LFRGGEEFLYKTKTQNQKQTPQNGCWAERAAAAAAAAAAPRAPQPAVLPPPPAVN